jgi:hypothetical protein
MGTRYCGCDKIVQDQRVQHRTEREMNFDKEVVGPELKPEGEWDVQFSY